VVGQLGPGDFFGEIAASDWGSGHGYVRTADITADSPTAVLLVPAEALLKVMTSEPAFRARIRPARPNRLTRM
jgi:CRP-like cAMP-binding protein